MHGKGNHKTKGQPLDWEKIFANIATKKGLIFENIDKQPNQKMDRRPKYKVKYCNTLRGKIGEVF